MARQPHRFHPDEMMGDNVDALLFDNCPACSENAAAPIERIDAMTLVDLSNRVNAVMILTDYFRSGVEATACFNLLRDQSALAEADWDDSLGQVP